MTRLCSQEWRPKKDMCYNEFRVMCSQDIHHSRFICLENEEGLCDHSKRRRIPILTAYKFCISGVVYTIDHELVP